jgi:hypothetical protein
MSTLVVVAGGLSVLCGLVMLLFGEDSERLRQWLGARERRWGVAAPVAAIVLVAIGIVLIRYWLEYRVYL